VNGEPTATALDAAGFAALMAPLGPFEAEPRIAVGVSGGADSLALALLVADWAWARGGDAIALTVDHRLRPGSAAEARQVHRWLRARHIRHHILVREGPPLEADLQAAARAARYRLLADWCSRRGVLHLALAHHRDDQAETLLLRLARGSGLDGLAAMSPIHDGGGFAANGPRLLRPLLGLPKAALEAGLRATGQGWIEDPSNASDAFARVRLRRLAPMLAAEGLTPARLAATAARLARARAALDDAVAALAAEAVALYPTGHAVLALGPWRNAAPEIALRCLARALMTVGGGAYTPRLERLERLHGWLAQAADAPRGARTLAGCRVERRGETALICREAAAAGETLPAVAGEVVRWDGRFLIRLGQGRRQGRGRVWIGPLGAAGWAAAGAAGLGRSGVPAPVRPSLPALWDDHGLVEAPIPGFRRPGAGGPLVESLEFTPAHPLAAPRFMVV
jgi:tRNA(Ile)-lysidine synthase